MMAQEAGKQQNTAYGVFVQACWAQHKRQYPDELIHKEIEEFNKQCSVWWYNLSERERERFQEMADRSNAQQTLANNTTYVTQQPVQQQTIVQNAVSSTSAGGIPSFGTSFTYGDAYGLQTASGQVVNAVVDQTGQVINYSTNAAPAGQVIQQRAIVQQQTVQMANRGIVQTAQPAKPPGKPMKDPNAPKKPLSAYFLFSQDERLKVKAEFPDYSITEVAKELGRRWATIDPALKQQYEQRYQDSRRDYETAMTAYKPQKKKKDPNAPKQPLSAYFIFSQEERLKVKNENPSFSICEVAKELGRRWADMAPEVKQRYQQMAEEGRQKYDQDMAAYRQGNFTGDGGDGGASAAAAAPAPGTVVTTTAAPSTSATVAAVPAAPGAAPATTTVVVTSQNLVTVPVTATTTAGGTTQFVTSGDYSSLLQ